MKILGLDMSVTHTGAVMMELDQNLEIVKTDFLTFVTSKKYASDNVIWYDPDQFYDKYDKYTFMQDKILKFAEPADVVAAEDYAYDIRSKGLVFDLAEFEGFIRQHIWRMGKPIYLYSPMTIKKIFTGHGDSDKLSMLRAFEKFNGVKPDISNMPIVKNGKKGVQGTSDVIDAYGACITLRTELLIRREGDTSSFPKHIQEFWKSRTRTVMERKLNG